MIKFKQNERDIVFRRLDEIFQRLDPYKTYSIDVIEHREKRSLDANAYCWVLIGKISEKINLDKTEVYRNAIKNIGGTSDIICVPDKAVEKLCESWEKKGLGWQTETIISKLEGCTNVVLYYGSSSYDSKQMSALIDNLVQDAKALDIDILPPYKIQALEYACR